MALLHAFDPERPREVKGAREMHAGFRKTVLVVNEGLLVSTVQVRDPLQESIASGICS